VIQTLIGARRSEQPILDLFIHIFIPLPTYFRQIQTRKMTDTLKIVTEGRDRWAEGFNIATADPKEVSDYIDYRRETYIYHDLQDIELWESYADDFGGFTQEVLELADGIYLRKLRATLRQYGVWVNPENAKEAIIRHLIECANLTEAPKWTNEQVADYLKDSGRFHSRRIDYQLEEAGRGRAMSSRAAEVNPATIPLLVDTPPLLPEERLRDQSRPANPLLGQSDIKALDLDELLYIRPEAGDPQYIRHRTYEPEGREPTKPPQRSYGRELANLSKMYTEELKYSGELDNFDYKLVIFKNMCQRADLPEKQWLMAYPTMLRGLALDHYFTNVAQANANEPLFEEVCNATRAYFEGNEFKRGALSRWNAVTLRGVMQKNPGKQPEECLQLMVTELRHIQHSLDQNLRTDPFLHNKLILACQDVPACEYACYRPSETLAGLINDLRSSIITRTKQGNPDSNQFSTTEQMFTDRRYHSHRPQKSQPFNRPPSQHTKRCFVCRKEGCWSTRHTKEEQEESKQRFRASLENPRFGRKGCPNCRTTGTVPEGPTRTFLRLFKYTPRASISARYSRNGVSALTT
jgi:hypothetical protein